MKGCTPNDVIGCLHFSNALEDKKNKRADKKTIKNMRNSGTILLIAICIIVFKTTQLILEIFFAYS